MKHPNIKLTRAVAARLIGQVTGGCPKLIREGNDPDAVIYAASTDFLTLRCENDWYEHNGRIRLTLLDRLGGSSMFMYFDPRTLERDFRAEDAEKERGKYE